MWRAELNRHGGTVRTGRKGALGLVLLTATVGACDFDVKNPGPTPDDFLNRNEAHQAIANGAARQLFDALNLTAYTTSAVTRETFPSGSTSAFGISASQQVGILRYNDEHVGWTSHQQSRAIAEQGFARFEENREGNVAGYRPAAEAALWAGYANRLLGENWCEAVIDGGGVEPRTVFLNRAEQWFTKAIEVAGTNAALANVAMAARAGRASVRVHLGNWEGAVADAGGVPTDFVFQAEYHITQQSHYNRIYFAGANRPYRAITTWNTFYEQYYEDTQDPRVPWGTLAGAPLGDAALGFMNNQRAPFYQQRKHAAEASNINPSSGREMRLIETEALLRGGNWQEAMTRLNDRRAELDLDPWPAADLNEAWAMFKRERGIELWLEGRRMGDLRRWQDSNTPGALHPLETPGNPDSWLVANRSLCYDIPQAEREANPNVPDQPGG
jgi:starch-binding outer membrane protein, SusD/RagB family